MRITQRTISRNYKRQLNTVMTKRASTMEKGQSGLAFNRLSDNVAAGVRAMKVQEERLTSERQLNTIENFREEFKTIDTNLDSIDSILYLIIDDRIIIEGHHFDFLARNTHPFFDHFRAIGTSSNDPRF